MNQNTNQLLGNLSEDELQKFAETAAKAGMSTEQALTLINKKIPAFINAVVEAIPKSVDAFTKAAKAVKDLVEEHKLATPEQLRSVATPKEWHLLNHAKKRRTRKKYYNRLLRRFWQQGEQKGGGHGER